MRIAVAWLAGTSLIALVSLSSCKDDETGGGPTVDAGTIDSGTTSDGSTPTDGGSSGDGAPTGDCAGADVAKAQTLAKMLGGWKWSASIENGTDVPFTSDCDATNGYFIGPDMPKDDYAQCAIARGEIVPVRGGTYPGTTTCTTLACSDMGLLMVGPDSAAVYGLGPNGKTVGSPAFYFAPIASPSKGEMNLAQSNVGGSLSIAKRLVRFAGVPACTK